MEAAAAMAAVLLPGAVPAEPRAHTHTDARAHTHTDARAHTHTDARSSTPTVGTSSARRARGFAFERMDDTFSDADIRSAFACLDLDANGFVGAGELRHVLMCMGELVTDAEVEGMLRMCDRDGDGQVSFREFRGMARNLDPATRSPPSDSEEDAELATAQVERERSTARAAAEKLAQSSRISAAIAFVGVHLIQPVHLTRVFEACRAAPQYREGGGLVDAAVCVEAFRLPPEDEHLQALLRAFAEEGAGSIDVRQLLVSLSTVCSTHEEQKIQFVFSLFDEDDSGSLSLDELASVLKATSMSFDATVSARRARRLLTSASITSAAPTLTLDDFTALAHRFPNVVFPTMKPATSATTALVVRAAP